MSTAQLFMSLCEFDTRTAASARARNSSDSEFFSAIKEGRRDDVLLMLSEGISPSATSPFFQPALSAAVQSGHVDIVRTLIDAGANVNARKFMGITSLHEAIRDAQSAPMVKLLLDAGAIVNDEYPKRNPYVQLALNVKRNDILAHLIEAGVRIEPFHLVQAVDTCNLEALRMLLKTDVPTSYGFSHAVCHAAPEYVQAFVNAKVAQPPDLLVLARKRGDERIAHILST